MVRPIRGRARQGRLRVRPRLSLRQAPRRGRRRPAVARGPRRSPRAGVLSADEQQALDPRADGAAATRPRRSASVVSGDDEDVHSFVERQLVERVGDAGKRLHTGRSRNEQVALDLRLYLRRRIRVVQDRLIVRVVAALVRAGRAGRRRADAGLHAPAPCPARARGALLAGARLRVPARLRALRRGVAPRPTRCRWARARSPATRFGIDVEFLRARLGFSRIVANSMDAVADRDFVSSVPPRRARCAWCTSAASPRTSSSSAARSSASSSSTTRSRPAAA